MRLFNTQLLTKCKANTQNASSTNTTLTSFLQDEINRVSGFIYAELQDYMTLKTATSSTVSGQQYYYLPSDVMSVETVVVTIGAVKYTLDIVDSQRKWDKLNAIIFSGTAIPTYFFVRRDDFGIWPIPQSSGYTITLNYTYRLKDMTNVDYSTGTISIANGSQTVTGSGTTFSPWMSGAWIRPTTSQYEYRIGSYNSVSSLSLENYFQESAISGDAYLIGESPELPPELHSLIPDAVALRYFAGFRKDKAMAQFWSNMFFTGDPVNDSRDIQYAIGGLLGAKKRYSSRSNSAVVRRRAITYDYRSRIWGTTLSM